jgi:hypothetical protein
VNRWPLLVTAALFSPHRATPERMAVAALAPSCHRRLTRGPTSSPPSPLHLIISSLSPSSSHLASSSHASHMARRAGAGHPLPTTAFTSLVFIFSLFGPFFSSTSPLQLRWLRLRLRLQRHGVRFPGVNSFACCAFGVAATAWYPLLRTAWSTAILSQRCAASSRPSVRAVTPPYRRAPLLTFFFLGRRPALVSSAPVRRPPPPPACTHTNEKRTQQRA